MLIYSNTQIRQAIENGRLVCHPFLPERLGYASLDLTLGYYYYRIDKQNERLLHNPFDKEDVERYFDGPYKAMPHGEWCALNGLKPVINIPLDHPVINLKPHEWILAHTHEFVGIVPPVAGEIKPLSTWERNGVSILSGGTLFGPGPASRPTLEIHNYSDHETILLPVGEPVAQAVFYETDEARDNFGGTASGTDQPPIDLDASIKVWSPDMLLPVAYQVERTKPLKIEGLSYD